MSRPLCELATALSLALVVFSACAHGSKTPSDLGAVEPSARPQTQTPVEVLWERGRFKIETDGTKVYDYGVRYRVLTESGAKAWSRIEASWQPWRQAKPELDVRVQTPGGEVLTLDPASVRVEPSSTKEGDPRRRVVADIPGMAVGSVVEQRIIQRETHPLIPTGADGKYFFGMQVPVAKSELILELPSSLPVALDVRGTSITPENVETDGRRVLTFTQESLESLGPTEKYLPGDFTRHPYVAFSTVPSWASVAGPLSKSLAGSVQGAELEAILKGIPEDGLQTDVVYAVLERVRTLVQSTGRRFGEGPLTPMHPEETLARGRGDDEDISALVVALLRARGLDARMVLVRSGPSEDVRPDIPGLEGFNRAVIKVEGPAPLWVDPGAPYTPAGQLPPELQGRWALVLDPEVESLERTPASVALDNRYEERRVFHLPLYGRARVVERTRAQGSIGARLRAQLDADGDVRAGIARYVRGQYGAPELGEVEASDPQDLRTPIEVSVEALETEVGHVDVTTATVELRLSVLFGWLPPLVRDAALSKGRPTENREQQLREMAGALVHRREHALVLPEPYVAELSFEVRPPAGFEVIKRPKDRELDLGPARFSATFFQAQGSLTGTIRFDTGKAYYEPDEMRALVAGLRRLWSEPNLQLKLEHRGATAISKGRVEEGIKSYASLVAAHPKSAEHRARLALGLVEVGLGDAARQVAREAVELGHRSILARYALGRVLAHDRVGRLHAPGFDRSGALAALGLVKALDPGHVRARAELAVLRAVDIRGVKYADPAGLEASVAEYRSLRHDTGVRAFDDELLDALLRAERFEEVVIEAREADRSLRRDSHWLAAQVALDGGLDGVDGVLEQLHIPDRAVPLVLTAGATALAGVGRYEGARGLLERAKKDPKAMGPLARQAERLQQVQPLNTLLRPPSDPVRVVQDVLALLLTGRVSAKRLRPFMSERYNDPQLSLEVERLGRVFSSLARAAGASRVPPRVLRDGVLSTTEYRVDGDPNVGFRVRALLEGRRPTWWFVRSEPASDGTAGFRVLATGATPAVLGELAIAALEDDKPSFAEQWLSWADDLLEARVKTPFSDPQVGEGERDRFAQIPYLRLRRTWPRDRASAALALSILSEDPQAVIGRLKVKVAAEAAPRRRDILSHALLLGLLAERRWKEAQPIAAGLHRRHGRSETLYNMHISVLFELEQWRSAEKHIRRRLRRLPQDRRALEQLANVETARGRFGRAEVILEALAARGEEGASSVVYNNLAWVSLFRGKVGLKDLQRAKKANALSKGRSPAEIHTLAALHAERGETSRTIELLRQRLELIDADAPESMDYYLLGRVMENMGLLRLARRAYLQVEADEGNRADSTHSLAQRRLRGMGQRSAI